MDAIRMEATALKGHIRRELATEYQRNARTTLITGLAALAFASTAVLALAVVAAARRRVIGRHARSIEALSQDNALAEFDRLSMGALLEALPVGVFVADNTGRILRANAVRSVSGAARRARRALLRTASTVPGCD